MVNVSVRPFEPRDQADAAFICRAFFLSTSIPNAHHWLTARLRPAAGCFAACVCVFGLQWTAMLAAVVYGCLQAVSRWEMQQYVGTTGDLQDIHSTFCAGNGRPENFWVAEAVAVGQTAPRLVGCVGLKSTGCGEGELVRLSVAPAFRSRRVGAELLTHLEEFARAHGVRRLELFTNHTLKPALKFYHRNQFVQQKVGSYSQMAPVPRVCRAPWSQWSSDSSPLDCLLLLLLLLLLPSPFHGFTHTLLIGGFTPLAHPRRFGGLPQRTGRPKLTTRSGRRSTRSSSSRAGGSRGSGGARRRGAE